MVVFANQHSPRGYDECGQTIPTSRTDDLNAAWEKQRKTYQQFVRTFDGYQDYQPVPGAVCPGPFVDKDERGNLPYKNSLMTTAGIIGTASVAFMIVKAILHP